MNKKVLAATLSVISNTALVLLKLVVGLMTGSVSIISEAAHSALDLLAAIIACFSVHESGRPADKEHPFGHGKMENLSGAIEAVLILAAAVFIIHEAMNKISNPHEVKDPILGVYVMGVSVVVNTLISQYLFRVAKKTDSIALEADAHHLSTDVWTSIGVFMGLLLIRVTGWQILDPVVALIVAVMIIRVAFSLTWKAALPLLDVQLPDEEVAQLRRIIANNPKVRGYHKLRTRKSGPYREVDLHLILPAAMPLHEAHEVAEGVEKDVRGVFPNTHIVTHIEPDLTGPAPTPNAPDTPSSYGEH